MTRRSSVWWLLWGLLLLCGCYRPSVMKLEPLMRPWLQPKNPKQAPKSAPQVQRLTAKKVVFHTLHTNPRLRWLKARQQAQQARVQGFSLLENPELRVQGLSGALAQGKLDALRIRLRWSPPFPSIHAAKQDRERALAATEAARLWIERYRLLANARVLLRQVQAHSLQLQLLQRQVLLKEKLWRWEVKREKIKLTTPLEVAARRIEYVQALATLRKARSRRTTSKLKLIRLLGVGGPCRIQAPQGFLRPSQARLSLRKLVVQGIKRSPKLATLRHLYRAHKAELWIQRAKRIPWLTFLQASYQFGESSWPLGFFFGAAFSVPLFDWNTGAIRLQQARLKSLTQQARIQVAAIVSRVHARHRRWLQAQKAYARHQKAIQGRLSRILKQIATYTQAPPARLWSIHSSAVRLQMHAIDQASLLYISRIRLDQEASSPVWDAFGVKLP